MTWQVFAPFGSRLDSKVKIQIKRFYELLSQENKKYNLTRITSWEDLINKHFFDSLLFTKQVTLTNQKVLDMGSGAGFPGIALKFFYPDLQVTLVESNQKKANFLRMVIKDLDLRKIEVIQDRAENYALSHRQEFDLVVSRALAPLRIFLELGAPLLKLDGFLVALKGPSAPQEQVLVKDFEKKLGLSYRTAQAQDYSYGHRVNLFYQKVKDTPLVYPRPYPVIKKEFNQLRKK